MDAILEASIAAKPCDICKSAAALLFCHHDSAFLCIPCDSKMHEKLALRHEKVWMCEVCEQAPASVNCKADGAALCVTCDRDIHSANPLSRRHERTPVVPFYDTAEFHAGAGPGFESRGFIQPFIVKSTSRSDTKVDSYFGNEDLGNDLCDSWVSSDLISTVTYSDERSDLKSTEFLISEADPLLEFDYHVSMNNQFNSGSDSVVPVDQNMILPIQPHQFIDHSPENRFEIDFTRSCINSYSNKKNKFTSPSQGHNISSLSMEVGVVPDEGSISEASYSYGRSMSSSIDLNGGGGEGNQGSQFSRNDREARVLRYREKRKNRKFQKTIRYASRKTYAENRPRIKGRFAKRTEVDDCGIDQCFETVSSGGFSITDSRYGIGQLM